MIFLRLWGLSVVFCFFQRFCQQSFTHPPGGSRCLNTFCSVAAGNNEAGTWYNGIVSEARSESAESWRCICVCCAFGQKGARQSRSDWTNAAHLIPQAESLPPVGLSARTKTGAVLTFPVRESVCRQREAEREREKSHLSDFDVCDCFCCWPLSVQQSVPGSAAEASIKFSLSCMFDWLSHCQVSQMMVGPSKSRIGIWKITALVFRILDEQLYFVRVIKK